MQIAKHSVVSIDYKLHLGDGKIIDESDPGDPLVYLQGHEQIVPGLENALEGKSVGDTLKVTVSPEDGYGEYDPDGVEEVPDRKSTRLNSSHSGESRMPSSA